MAMKTYTRLSFSEREVISQGLWADESLSSIALRLGRRVSTVSQEVKKNCTYRRNYRAVKAQKRKVEQRKRQAKPKKLAINDRLREYVYKQLWEEWSPEEIAKRVKLEYPQDSTMRISHETIYQHLYCLPRGELKKELMKGLRQERKKRQPKKKAHQPRKKKKNKKRKREKNKKGQAKKNTPPPEKKKPGIPTIFFGARLFLRSCLSP